MKQNPIEYSQCGVGLLVSRINNRTYKILKKGLIGLCNVEHRGGADKVGNMGDGAGIMTEIPWKLLGLEEGKYAVATLFAPQDEQRYRKSLEVFEETFAHYYLNIEEYREVPINPDALGLRAKENMPRIVQAFIRRPEHCRTFGSFDDLLYMAKQMVRTKQKDAGIKGEFFFTSLSSRTIVYKALATSKQLAEFYPDLENTEYETKYAMFHRRFSTNTLPSWDKVQPFRLVAHNGEINTIEGNRAAAVSRERSIGLRGDQLITHDGSSDSGNLNGMVEALKYRSSIPHINEILAIMIPPADGQKESPYFHFWSRAMEPWDGPALIGFCDGKRIGARLDRSGFRPCRWHKTRETFYLSSEAGSFELDPKRIEDQGELYAGRSVSVHIYNGEPDFANPNKSGEYHDFHFDARLHRLETSGEFKKELGSLHEKLKLFHYSKESLTKELYPMVDESKEPIGSMGDTARMVALSDIKRPLYHHFFQNFAQVTNPPLDYIREKMVTDMEVILGRKPNIFEPKEMIPPAKALSLDGPVVGLAQLEKIKDHHLFEPTIRVAEIQMNFDSPEVSVEELKRLIDTKAEEAYRAVQNGSTILILSDREASRERPPLPALLVLRSIQTKLSREGVRMKASLVVDSGEIYNAHQLAVLIGFGASAVCPYIALGIAREDERPKLEGMKIEKREELIRQTLETGLMRIMGKAGISVVRSYQGSELFTILGFGDELSKKFFPKHDVLIGGTGYPEVVESMRTRLARVDEEELANDFYYKEHASGKKGERHSPTAKSSRAVHKTLQEKNKDDARKEWIEHNQSLSEVPLQIRDLFDLKENKISTEDVEPLVKILPRFGSGAMSFGSISAEAQRDLIKAFRTIGGRSNSGEGGENPYYYTENITAKIKQIASGRFGVTAEYLVVGDEVQIKIAQGAKPGEGGQLPGHKVSEEIAFARHSTPGVGLISPPPQHDIYSIEDLKELIYEIKQLRPSLKVSVKLVSGKNIGAIALGVVKAGADIIQISGGSGGTGAASLMSMKHAGLPWEIGLIEVHRLLCQAELRDQVVLRVDGGLINGLDIIKAAIWGAEEFDFGKMVLVAEGCIMARVCEKNTCPAGIATQDPKFKKRYKGTPEKIVSYLEHVARDVRESLALMGIKEIKEIIGRTDLLSPSVQWSEHTEKLDLNYFIDDLEKAFFSGEFYQSIYNDLNQKIIEDYYNQIDQREWSAQYTIHATQRAVGASLSGLLAQVVAEKRKTHKEYIQIEPESFCYLSFKGSAGQGFGVFNQEGVFLNLEGEANDSVGKAMSGGRIVVRPHAESIFHGSEQVLVGNVALYGATGGQLYIAGLAGDRFAIRNSGANAVVEGVGLHACEYMTGGHVLILGRALENVGAGMTGGQVYMHKENLDKINLEYLKTEEFSKSDLEFVKTLLIEHIEQTQSKKAQALVDNFKAEMASFVKLVPVS
jgi:glutamate synthase domain-containing protein 2/glutamate synthase domain-containing protein 1/glutamate synthase domain-containing protein 3